MSNTFFHGGEKVFRGLRFSYAPSSYGPAYTDDEFIMMIADVVVMLDHDNEKLQKHVSQMPCSRYTTKRHIFQTNVDIARTMQNSFLNSHSFNLGLDKSTDTQDNPQIATFVRHDFTEMAVKEKLLNLVVLKKRLVTLISKMRLMKPLTSANAHFAKRVRVTID